MHKLKDEPPRIALGALFFALGLLFGWLELSAISLISYVVALVVSGGFVFLDAIRGIMRRDFLDEKLLMSVASVGAFIIGEATEGAAVMLFFLVGEYFEHKAVRRSRSSIKELMDICPDTAVILRDGEEIDVDADEVEVGDTVVIRSGERVPVDCEVLTGTAELDTSMLTGEAMPLSVAQGSLLESGTVVIGGRLVCRALSPAESSRAARTLELMENATERKSREENFITAFSRYYTPSVIVFAFLMALVPPIFGMLTISDSVYRALSFLVVSCPCALVISVPMAFFGGIGSSAAQGILYKGGNTFSAISHVKNVVFDKTGTLTTGELVVSGAVGIIPAEELISMAAAAENASNHPIALALKKAAVLKYEADELTELPGMGVVARINGKQVAVGNEKLMSSLDVKIPEGVKRGSVLVSSNGELLGSISFADSVKDEAKAAISELRRLGVEKTYILSGDAEDAVRGVALDLGIDEYHAELMPEDKFNMLESIIDSSDGKTLFVGDGINDAPSIARADVGIAMGGRGQDSAIEAADAVIVSDNLLKLPSTVGIARKTLRIAKENIVFAIGVKLLVLLLVSLGLAGMWLAVFADVGVAVIAILNSMRTLVQKRKK